MKHYFLVFLFVLMLLPQVSLAASTTERGGQTCGPLNNSLCNPVQGSLDVGDFLKYTMVFVGDFLGLIAILTLVYAGFRMVTANGNDKVITEQKNTITYAIAGFIVSVLAYVGILAIINFIGVKTTAPKHPNTIVNPFGPGATLETFIAGILQNTIMIAGLVALFMIILNGFRYMTARGDDKQVEAAKKGLTWSLVGLAIILFAYVIISAVANLLGK